MKTIIESNLVTLEEIRSLLLILTNEELCNNTIPPYCSSLGSHIRHVLDFYDCVLRVSCENKIDLTNRKRNYDVENKCESALQYLDQIIIKLENIENIFEDIIIVIDDLGLGKIEMKYTFEALIAQANSHTIHHYAIMNYILDRLQINLQGDDFGYNPSTPKAIT